jgi:hypothetical protein
MILAIALIVLGVIALIYQGFSYTTRGDTLDLGPLEITTQEEHRIPLPPIIGVAALTGGIALLAFDLRKR